MVHGVYYINWWGRRGIFFTFTLSQIYQLYDKIYLKWQICGLKYVLLLTLVLLLLLPLHSHYTGQPAFTGTPQKTTEFCCSKVLLPT